MPEANLESQSLREMDAPANDLDTGTNTEWTQSLRKLDILSKWGWSGFGIWILVMYACYISLSRSDPPDIWEQNKNQIDHVRPNVDKICHRG